MLYSVHKNPSKFDIKYRNIFKYGDCADEEREMKVDGDVSWQIILDKHC